MTTTHDTAIIAKRVDSAPVETDEIEALVEAAGFEVVAILTQVRREDPGTYLGSGKVNELVEIAERREPRLVVVDGELTTGQASNLINALPDDVELVDRYRLILDIFAQQAHDRRAQLQVELVRLRYELDWFAATIEEDPLTKHQEKGSPRYQLQDRIKKLERELNELPDPGEHHRECRREAGFDFVTIAGYTNAGKSTLLRRLADELSIETDTHQDEETSAAVEDRLFKTLETTTRRATLRGRRVLCTDTVGYIDDLPHELVVSFAETLSEASVADVVILLTDATDSPDRFEQKLRVSLSVLKAQGVEQRDILPVLNKVDMVSADSIIDQLASLQSIDHEPIAISAVTGENVETLIDTIVERLPSESTTITTHYSDTAMSLVSEAYDRAIVTDIQYADDQIYLELEGRPTVVEELSNRVAQAVEPTG